MSILDRIENLRMIQANQNEGYVERFERALASIAELRDPECIVLLAGFLNDESDFDELMFSIIHTIEMHEDVIYCQELLKAAPTLCVHSPRWASILFMRILNSDPTCAELLRQVKNAPMSTKNAVRILMEQINQRSEEFVAKTSPVIIATTS